MLYSCRNFSDSSVETRRFNSVIFAVVLSTNSANSSRRSLPNEDELGDACEPVFSPLRIWSRACESRFRRSDGCSEGAPEGIASSQASEE